MQIKGYNTSEIYKILKNFLSEHIFFVHKTQKNITKFKQNMEI